MLSCDAKGNLFTQLIGRSVYRRIQVEAQRREVSPSSYATIYWNTGTSRYTTIFVEIGDKESWALERILEHAFRSAVIPDVLIRPLGEIMKLVEGKQQELIAEKARVSQKTAPVTPLKVLNRLPYYKDNTSEVSIPIYKAEYAFPLIILKRLSQEENVTPGQQLLLILDSEGDLAAITLPEEKISEAEIKLSTLREKGIAGSLICLRKPEGTAVDVMEISDEQRQALESMTQHFNNKGTARPPFSDAVNKVLTKIKGIATT